MCLSTLAYDKDQAETNMDQSNAIGTLEYCKKIGSKVENDYRAELDRNREKLMIDMEKARKENMSSTIEKSIVKKE